MTDVVRLAKRSALLFSDGSLTVHAEQWPMEKVLAEREEADKGAKVGDRTKIARVTVAIEEILLDPDTMPDVKEFCSGCNHTVEVTWTYCPHCGAQARKRYAAMGGSPRD
jgi:hypothetical protein